MMLTWGHGGLGAPHWLVLQWAGIFQPKRQSACFISQSPVSLLQHKGCCFGLPLPAENTFLVPDDTSDPCGHKKINKQLVIHRVGKQWSLSLGQYTAREGICCNWFQIVYVWCLFLLMPACFFWQLHNGTSKSCVWAAGNQTMESLASSHK